MFPKFTHLIAAAVLLLCPVFAGDRPFTPDATFKGSSLAGWQVLGQADWQGRDGELIGKAKPGGGGWLVLDKSFQDVGFYASFQCVGECQTGVLLRAEKTAGGMKGIYVSLTQGDLASYRVALDATGREVSREPVVRAFAGFARFATPPDPSAVPRGGGRGMFPGGPRSTVPLPITPKNTALRPGEWNEIDIICDANMVRPSLNGGYGIAGGFAPDEAGRYGKLALYVGGTGEVHFKEVGYKDLAIRVTPEEKVSPRFRMQRLNDMNYSWSAAAADFNRDGVLDLVAGPYIYYGPDFQKSREIYPAVALSPGKDFTSVNCQWAYDFNGDGWPDILTGPSRAMLYINPKGESRRWDSYEVVKSIQSEVALLQDIDGDGKPELVFSGAGSVRYAKPDPADPTKPWIQTQVSENGYGIAHGLGVGDINGDGRIDILNPYGWWEQPPAGTQGLWKYHSQAFSRAGRTIGGAGMFVYDVNGDGLNDVVTSLEAHGYGLAWYEQKRSQNGTISFVEHIISDGPGGFNAGGVVFSEPHGTAMGDVDGDGVPDFIVGKRYWSHLDSYLDPDPYGPPVLFWYRTVRNPKAPGGAEFVPEMIHNRSGAGSDILAVDLNRDGALDIITSTDRGTFIFWGQKPAKKSH